MGFAAVKIFRKFGSLALIGERLSGGIFSVKFSYIGSLGVMIFESSGYFRA